MVTKTTEQETDRAGKRLVRSILESLGWVVNDTVEDYGIDSNVQVFDGESPNGAWFHVQLKSSLNPEYSADKTFISQSLRMDHARHFAIELRQPIFLLIADVTNSRLFWTCPQLDNRLLNQIQAEPNNMSVTVRVPTAQHLPHTVTDLLSTLRNAHLVLSCRELATSPMAHFVESLAYSPNQEKLRTEMQNKSDILKLKRITDLYHEGNKVAARERADSLTRDPDTNIETKFWASIQIANIDIDILIRSNRPQAEHAEYRLQHAISLQRLTRLGPKPFRFYALVARRAAELDGLAHENFSLSMLQKAHFQRGGNPFLVWRIYARRAWLAKAITAKYNQCVRLASCVANSNSPWILGRALPNVIQALATYLVSLHINGETELESAFAQSALQLSKLAARASRESEDENGLALAVLNSILVVRSEDSDTYKWAMETAVTIHDLTIREDVLQGIKRASRRWSGEEVEGDITGDLVWQALQNMATVRGVDISDESSPLVQALRIAVRDDTPDRVLKECEHLLVSYGAIGPLALEINAIFNMKTACSKVVHCTLHNFHSEAKDLDSAYGQFKKMYCSKCVDQQPRPADWVFNGRPTPHEAEFLSELIGTQYDIRHVDDD